MTNRATKALTSFKSPRETMEYFLISMDRVKHGDNSAMDSAVSTLDLAQIDYGSRNTIGRLSAERLVNTMDRLAKVNLSNIPNYEEGPTWYYRKQTINFGNAIHDVEIAIHKTTEGWKFTPETVDSIEDYYNAVARYNVVAGVVELKSWKSSFKNLFPAWTGEQVLLLKNGQWLGLILVIFFSFLSMYAVRFFATFYTRNNAIKSERYKSTFWFGLLTFALVFKLGILLLEFDVEILEYILRGDYIFTAVCAVMASLKVVDLISFKFENRAKQSDNKFDDVLVPMLKKTAKVLVMAFGALFVAHSLTFDVGSILAGLGIGGVAVALAAKDTISNLFGSVTVILDRPFNIGDFVVLDKGVEGTIEQVGFRSTRIRTPLNSLITMPNSVLANMAIDNYGMRSFRRYKTLLQLDYRTSENELEKFILEVREFINQNKKIEKVAVEASVYIYELTESSIDIQVVVYFDVKNGKEELEERHNLIKGILKIANSNEINFAYPTRTVFIQNNEQ
jgi:MscS family membrane protein